MPNILLIAQALLPLLLTKGTIPANDVSIGGVVIGDSPAQVESKLGKPRSEHRTSDFLDLRYDYPDMTVSFSDGTLAGLFTDSPRSCTPKRLCPGDSLKRMRAIYGEPVVADRETGRFYEYYGYDLYCWLQIPANGSKVTSIAVACQP